MMFKKGDTIAVDFIMKGRMKGFITFINPKKEKNLKNRKFFAKIFCTINNNLNNCIMNESSIMTCRLILIEKTNKIFQATS